MNDIKYIRELAFGDTVYVIKDAEARESIEELKESTVAVEEGKGLSTNDFTDEYKKQVDDNTTNINAHLTNAHAPANAEKNVIVGIKKNGTALSIASDRTVNVTVPTALSELTSDNNHELVTSDEKEAWNNKVDKVEGSSLISSTDLAQITTNKNDIDALKGSGTGSIDAMIDAKINTWATQLTNDGIVNTYAEAINWIATHASDYTALIGEVSNKVDKVSGKGLSTEDFTTVLKNKLEGLNVTDTYDATGTDPVSGTAVAEAISSLAGDDGTLGNHIKDTNNPHSVTASQVGLGNLTNDKQVIGLSTGTTSGHIVTWGDDGYSVADSGYTIATSVPSDAKFTDTTYSKGTASALGLTKLYTETGTNSDGTMTQNAITGALGEKADNSVLTSHTSNISNPHSVTASQVGLGNLTDDKQVKGLSKGTTSGHVVTWGTDGYTIGDSGYTIESSVPSGAVFTDTTYDTGTENTSGLTKLYTGTGTNIDGTMTQAAINTALGEKADSSTFNTHANNTSNPHNVTASQVGLGNLTDDKQVKGLSKGTTSGHVVTWGTDGYTVADSGYTIESSVPSGAVFTDTTYSTGTSSTAGLTKLYTSTGNNTDGTMTQAAIDKALSEKANSSNLGTAATTDASAYATAAQGSTADTAVQSVKIGTSTTEYKSGTTVTLPAYPTTLPASDVSDWAKASTKPTYTYDEVGALPSSTTLADLTTDSDHLTVSTTEKNTWNNKVDKVSGSSLISSTDLAQITTNKNDISTLKGSGTGSIDAMIDAKINTWATQLTDDGTVNTYAEAINWIATHASDYTALIGEVSNKVDKVSGKGLSTEDFTTVLKNKLEGLNVTDTYDATGTDPVSGTAVAAAISGLTGSSGTVGSHVNDTNNPHSVTASQVGLGNLTNNKQVKGLASGTTSGHVVTWGSDGFTVADSGYTIGVSVPSDAKFTDTTYSTGTSSTAGLTKLYTGTGTNTDGTMTQSAINTALGDKADSSTLTSHTGNTSNPHSVTASQVGLGNLTNDKQVKGLSSGTTSGHVVTWGSDGYTVADSGYTIATSVPSGAVFTDTTYSTGTSSTAGLTKLYTGTGTNTDGTMTQSAINTALGDKADSSTLTSHTGNTSNPHSVTASQVGLGNLTNNKQVKGLASGTTSGHVVTWGSDGYTVADSGYTIATSVPSGAVFTDTTYSTGTASALGLTKLYTSTGTATDGTMTRTSITTALNAKATMLKFTSKSVATSAWSSDTTYSDYPYRASVSCSGVTSSYFAEVVFSPSDATSGNYAPICVTGSSIVYIYAKEKPSASITIPSIVAFYVA